MHFHPLRIQKITRETPDCVSISFNLPPEIADTFKYKEGQNITIRSMQNQEEIRRSYSICTAPHEQTLKVAIKKVPGGIFSSIANEGLKEGDLLEVLPPTGNFNTKYPVANGNYLAIAAGSGITPILGIIKHNLFTQENSSFTLLYGNKNRASIVFFEELEALKNKYMNRFNYINILSREKTEATIHYGRIDADKLNALKAILDFKSFTEIFICGPEQLIFTANDFLQNEGVEKSRIHFELFTIPGQKSSVKQTEKTNANDIASGPQCHVTVKLDGRSFDFMLPYEGMSILDAALQQGADLPYACKGGVCCTCKARLTSGKVNMDVNYALEPDEVEDGFILSCQSHPRSEHVMVDFDIK